MHINKYIFLLAGSGWNNGWSNGGGLNTGGWSNSYGGGSGWNNGGKLLC